MTNAALTHPPDSHKRSVTLWPGPDPENAPNRTGIPPGQTRNPLQQRSARHRTQRALQQSSRMFHHRPAHPSRGSEKQVQETVSLPHLAATSVAMRILQMLDLNLAKAANRSRCEKKSPTEAAGIRSSRADAGPGPSLTCFIMECSATEGKRNFLSIMFNTWQSLGGRRNRHKAAGSRGAGQSWGLPGGPTG